MAIKIIGDKKDVARYRKMLADRGYNTKANPVWSGTDNVHKHKPDGYRLIEGQIVVKQQKTDHGRQSARGDDGKPDPNPDERLEIIGIANAAVVDRMDEVLNPKGIDIKNYIKNPILLADHMYWTSTSIGKVTEIRAEADGVHFDAWVGDPKAGPLTQLQKDVRSLIRQGILSTVSVGFIPKQIIAPVWDDEGKLVKPAIIEKWELLELSVVAVPCNPDATFEMKEFTKQAFLYYKSAGQVDKQKNNVLTTTKTKIDNIKKQQSTIVQSLVFDSEMFTVSQAKKWADDHDFKSESVDETDGSIRLRQRDPDDFIEESFKTIDIDDGIKAVVGRLKEGNDEMDEKTAMALVDGVKSLASLLTTLNANIDRNVTLSETILGYFEKKEKPKMNDDEDEDEDKKPKEVVAEEEEEEEKPKVEEEEEEEKEKSINDELTAIKDWMANMQKHVETLSRDLGDTIQIIKALVDSDK